MRQVATALKDLFGHVRFDDHALHVPRSVAKDWEEKFPGPAQVVEPAPQQDCLPFEPSCLIYGDDRGGRSHLEVLQPIERLLHLFQRLGYLGNIAQFKQERNVVAARAQQLDRRLPINGASRAEQRKDV